MDLEQDDFAQAGPGAGFEGEISIVVREQDGRRQAVLVPRGIERLGEEGHFWMHELQGTAIALRQLTEKLAEQVEGAREAGLSWDSIGFCIGTTGRAVQMRFGEDLDEG